MKKNISAVAQLAIDHYRGVATKFGEKVSKDETEQTLRDQFNEILKVSEHKNFRHAFEQNKRALFNVLEDTLEVLITEGLENQFEGFVDYQNVAVGDKKIFMIDDYHLFNVSTISAGNNNLRRQKQDRSAFEVPTAYKGVKIYAELEEFLAGKIDWAKVIGKVQRSFNAQMAADINAAMVTAYGTLGAPYADTGSWDLDKFNNIVAHVEAATGVKPMVVGTKLALSKAVPQNIAYNGAAIQERNELGFFRVVDGTVAFELKQSHKPGTDTFAIANDQLLIVPAGYEQIVKGVIEGDAIIDEDQSIGSRQDQTKEFLFQLKYGFGVAASTKYGVYTLS